MPAQLDDRNAQQRLFWQVTGFLGTLAEQTPLALLLDDLHWADSASLDLLQHLARHARERPILLVGTAREVEAQRQHPLADALSDLRRDESARADRGATARVGGDERVDRGDAGRSRRRGEARRTAVSPQLAQRIYARSEGNAFFTRQLTRALQEQGEASAFAEGQWRLTRASAARSRRQRVSAR